MSQSGGAFVYPIAATVTASGAGAPVIDNLPVTVAYAEPWFYATGGCNPCADGLTQFDVGGDELFGTAFRTAVTTSDPAPGIAMDGTIEEQNIPGEIYNTESGMTISPTGAAYTGSGIG